MARKGNWLRRVLYRVLPLETYLWVLSKLYFLSFNLGLIKNNRLYVYPYFLKNIVKKGDVCIDIGANLGYISVILAQLVGKTGKVYSVEPVKPVRAVLTRNTKQYQQVEIMPYALGEEDKAIKLGNNSLKAKGFVASGSHFVLDAEAEAEVEFTAQMKKGSALFADLPRLDFIKCDIEGFEIVVLPELAPVIDRFNPLLLVETSGDSRRQLMDFFSKRNYEALVWDGTKLQTTSANENWDILFIPKAKLSDFEAFLTP